MQDSKECPRYHTPQGVWAWMDLYGHYQAGHLYRAGGVSAQPALYMQVMRLIDGVVKEPRSGEVRDKIQNSR